MRSAEIDIIRLEPDSPAEEPHKVGDRYFGTADSRLYDNRLPDKHGAFPFNGVAGSVQYLKTYATTFNLVNGRLVFVIAMTSPPP